MTSEPGSESALESWKEIAAYLRRDVRTVKRWEKSEGLPVRRHLHQARSSVYAYPSDLDAWWAARSPGLTRPAAPPARSRLASRIALAAAMFVTLATSRSGPAGVVRAAAPQRTGTSLTEIFTGQIALELSAPARFSPDGRRLAATDNGYLVVMDVETEARTRLTATNWDRPPYGFVQYPVWSPDGTRLAYGWFSDDRSGRGRWELRVVPAGGGRPEVLFSRADADFFPGDWSPDGRQILGWLDRWDGHDSVATVSAATGDVTELRTWEKTPGTAATGTGVPMYSPDGRTIAYGKTVGNRNRVFLFDVTTRTETALTGPSVSDRLPIFSPDGATLLFASDRSGRWDLWALPLRDAAPAGEPRLAYADLGDVREICGWDGRGGLVFTRPVTFGQLYTVAVDPESGATLGPPERPVAQYEGKHMMAVWSPNGRRLVLLAQTRERGGLYEVALDSGEVRELNTLELGWTRVAGWLPSSDAVVVSSMLDEFGLYLVRPAGGAPERLYADRQTNWGTAQLSPNGAAFAATAGNTVRVVDLGRKELIREATLQPGEFANGFAWAPDGRTVYAGLNTRVLRIPLPSGGPQEIAAVPGLRSIALSPDGRTLAVTRIIPSGQEGGEMPERYQLYVVGSEGGDLKRVQVPDGHRPWRVRWAADGRIGYISWQAKTQFLRLGGFLGSSE